MLAVFVLLPLKSVLTPRKYPQNPHFSENRTKKERAQLASSQKQNRGLSCTLRFVILLLNLNGPVNRALDDRQKFFRAEFQLSVIHIFGKCPRCGESVYEGKKNYYCGNRSCQFVMWKNDRFLEERGKAFTPKIAAALLKDGKAKVKGLRSMKTGKTYDGTVLLADTGGKYVNYRVEQRGKNERQQA